MSGNPEAIEFRLTDPQEGIYTISFGGDVIGQLHGTDSTMNKAGVIGVTTYDALYASAAKMFGFTGVETAFYTIGKLVSNNAKDGQIPGLNDLGLNLEQDGDVQLSWLAKKYGFDHFGDMVNAME